MLPQEIKLFIEVFSKLPGIGPRQATRLAFRLITGSKSLLIDVANAVAGIKKMKICSQCFFVHSQEGSLCHLCADPHREVGTYLIVEKETDLLTVERTGSFRGKYLVLGDLSKNGTLESFQKLRLNALKKIIEKEMPSRKAREIVLAFNPTPYGDITASLAQKELSTHAEKISRLGRGIPTGGEIEFADEETLESALERRM